jgi:hypothetical protein
VQSKEEENEYKPPTSSLQRTLQDIENSIKSEKRKLSNHDNSNNTDISEKSRVNALKNKPTGTPEYNPTPIRELKKQRVEGKLGRSKYDLALLDGPANDGEYDPACNFSTGSKSSTDLAYIPGSGEDDIATDLDSIPDYAKHLQGVKRPAEDEDIEDDGSPLAKIPKFVSVEYTPAVNESVEYSDEEPLGEKQDWFSDEASEKGSESGAASDNDPTADRVNNSNNMITDKRHADESKNLLPIEFTSDGFVKSAYIEKHGEKKDKTKSVRKEHDKRKRDSINKISSSGKEMSNVGCKVDSNKDTKQDMNIFSLFKEEFDNELENCEISLTQNDTGSLPKVKLKQDESKNSLVPKTSTSCEQLSLKDKNNSQKKTEKSDTDKLSSAKRRSSSEHRHSSKSSDSVHKSSSHSKKERDDKNGIIRDKHKHSSRSEDHSVSKHKSSSSSSSSKDRHSGSDGHSSSIKHSSDSKKSKHGSPKASSHHSKEHKKSDRDSRRSSERHSHSSSKSRHHSDKPDKSSESKHRDSRSGKEKSKKKKQIVNLDVDLFGVETDEGLSRHVVDDDDLSDLDKYFMDDDPFDECLKIFNEEATNKPSTSREGDKKVCNLTLYFCNENCNIIFEKCRSNFCLVSIY